jgi:uncharacterized protein (TIGR02271 family)
VADIKEGMQVLGGDNRPLGTVERLHGDGFHVGGRHYSSAMVARVAGGKVHLRAGATTEAEGTTGDRLATAAAEGEIRVPVAEERLTVGKREVALGEIGVRTVVTEEEQTASVTLRHEEVRVETRDIADRPLRPGEDAFAETTIRVPVRGEEAVVSKEAVVTGEVVIDKDRVAEERQITDTVRRERVDVDEHYRQMRGEFEQLHAARAGGTGRGFAEAEPNYRTGFAAGHDERYAGREFAEVEPELRRDHATRGVTDDRWRELREEIEQGWNKARHR